MLSFLLPKRRPATGGSNLATPSHTDIPFFIQIKRLAGVAPLGALAHLKRIRRRLNDGSAAAAMPDDAAADGAPQPPLEVLLCPLPDDHPAPSPGSGAPPPPLPPALAALAHEFALTPRSALVPAHPPPTLASVAPGGAWAGAWPTATRRADQRLVAGGGPDREEADGDGAPTVAAAGAACPLPPKGAAAFLALAEAAAREAGVGNAAVVVDPSGRSGALKLTPGGVVAARSCVVATAVDARGGGHPLRHAVVEVLDAVARRDLELWPADGPASPDK